jgi:hypothetical protein
MHAPFCLLAISQFVEYLHYFFYFDPGKLVFLIRSTWYCVVCVGESFFSFFLALDFSHKFTGSALTFSFKHCF